ncbi:MAG: PQQ-binding-like beta-propeller repeat protein [Bryobacteraceae bacterium]
MKLALPLLAAIASTQDWPQLLGPERNGVYSGPWSEKASFKQLWKKPIGAGFASPVVASGRVIVFHRRGDDMILESLDPASGSSQWTFQYKTDYRDDFGFSDGPRAAPTVEGGRVYAYGAEGILHCLDLAKGTKIWNFDARERFQIRKEFFGAATVPLVDGDRVFMNIGGADGAGIVALDKATGKTVWKALTSEAGYSSPVAATIGGQRHILFFTREGLVDADPADGRIRFQRRWRARMAASVNAAMPLVAGNEVFLSSSYNTGAILLRIEGDSASPVWQNDESLSNHYATSVYKDGYLYGYHGRQEEGQELRAVEWKSGKVAWKQEGFGAGTVTLAGSHLFLLREDGELVIAPASPKGFRPVKKVRVASSKVRAYPAIAAGRLYVRTDDTLSCWAVE